MEWIKIEIESDLPKDAIKRETRFWMSYNNIAFIGYFYKSYGGLNYCCADFDGLPDGVKGYHMGNVSKLDGYQQIINPKQFKTP